jgi:succinyl-CoA synthetase alpha subunit
MLDINKLRQLEPKILVVGSPQPAIVQSILDFDYLSGRAAPSIQGILVSTSGRKNERYFWGKDEFLLKRYAKINDIAQADRDSINLFVNMSSGRRVLFSTKEVVGSLKNLVGGVVFAENVPEKNALELYQLSKSRDIFILGPASVGLVIPTIFKLGPIGGLTPDQLVQSGFFQRGDIALFSASGGMVGEMITVLANNDRHLSFSLTFGGDRFPVLTPIDAFLAAEKDPETHSIVYYGELGGTDEYDVVELMKSKKITKKVVAFIAGSVSEMFDAPPQFGHAKAMAKKQEETAQAKRKALQDAGASVAGSFQEFVTLLKSLPGSTLKTDASYIERYELIQNRRKKMFISSLSYDKDDTTTVLGKDILSRARLESFSMIAVSMFLGREIKSKELEEFSDFVFKLLMDNGPYQSGAVNTMITARAGRDMVSAVSSGLLTIGPRFGGATNDAAKNWFRGVTHNLQPYDFVEEFAREGNIISGIGHLKYRADLPDPRVVALTEFAEKLKVKRFLGFAKEIEKITLAKKGNLILNVDGIMAAILLDLLFEKEGLSEREIEELLGIEFFNAFFVLPRTVGYIGHFLDQKRLDEGLFRLSSEDVSFVK